MSSKKLRIFPKIPIFVVENHNEVNEFIYRCIGSRHLPLQGNKIIHLDSHPDMGIPKNMKSSDAFNKDHLLENLDIENWMMPSAFTGVLTDLVWIKPPWAEQMPEGDFEFIIGQNNGKIRVSCPFDYFISEALYQPEYNLEDRKLVKLKVGSLEVDMREEEFKYILDVDLDFFSTFNPFLNLYEKAECYKKLKIISSYEGCKVTEPEEIFKKMKEREDQLNYLEEVFRHLSINENFEKWNNKKDERMFPLIESLIKDLKEEYTEIDYMKVFDALCTCDNIDLPHHESTDEEIDELMDKFSLFLKKLPEPTIITISRSSEDDYCPPEQVDLIQEKVLNILKDNFKDKLDVPIFHYEGDEWEV